MNATKNTTTLGAYTKAQNCTDLADVNAGIEELRLRLKNRDYKAPAYWFGRLAKLEEKKKKFEAQNN